MQKLFLYLTIFSAGMLLLSSCATVKPYQMAHLNQQDMALNTKEVQRMETNFQSYREGASGANGGKTGGGCGCN